MLRILGMGRPLRFVPDNCLVEVTTRTLQGRYLLRPHSNLNDLVLGVLGRAMHLWPGVDLFAFAFLSNHYHMLLRTPDAATLSAFVGFLNSNVAREVGRLYDWPERFWGRRFRSIPVLHDEAAVGRLKYILAHGAKEGLVASPEAWPGPHCVGALTRGDRLVGTWFDRTGAYLAQRRGLKLREGDFAQQYRVHLKPLPSWESLRDSERKDRVCQMVRDIEAEALREAEASTKGFLGPDAIRAQEPHTRPRPLKRSSAPLVHATGPGMRLQFRRRYRAFVAALRAASTQAADGSGHPNAPGNPEQPSAQVRPVPAHAGVPP